MHISGLFVYPIKSGAGLSVQTHDLDTRGLRHDREYMVVDPQGVFLTQREEPRLALVRSEPGPVLRVHTPIGSADVAQSGAIQVRVWDFGGPAVDCGDEVADVLGDFLGRHCRLVRVPDDHARRSDDGRAAVGFADGYPLLLTGEESLRDLNSRMAVPLTMDRFRPNVVVAGSDAFAEDGWARIELGPVSADVVKPCVRCTITGVDQATGRRGDGEPLRTLATFRRMRGGVTFGQNLVHAGTGTLQVGDPVTVRERRL